MFKKLLLITGMCFLSINILYPQSQPGKYGFNISSGYGFKEKKPVVYFDLNYKAGKDFCLGIKAGCYAYDESVDEVVTRRIADIYPELYPGTYMTFLYFKKQSPTYVTAISGEYRVVSSFAVNLSLGVRYYMDKYYELDNFMFSKSYKNQSPPEVKITPNDNLYFDHKKDILRGYISAGFNFKFKTYSIGAYADNIISAGINLGKEF